MTAKIHIERMMHRSSVMVQGDSASSYALLKLIPAGLDGVGKPMGLNLALALDVSGSMYEEDGTGISRLKRIQDAAISAMKVLKLDDTMAIIGFAHNALCLLPPTKIAEKDKIEDVIRRIDMFDVDPGGTAMNDGMRLALDEVEKQAGAGKLSQVLVLTDGETSGEQDCRKLAERAHEKKIHLTLMGVGLDWKAGLIKDLAKISEGKWYYIDVNEKKEAERIFVEEFESLAAAGFMNVELHVRSMKDVKVKRIRQVSPEIKELSMTEPEERHQVYALGTLQKDTSARCILDLVLPKRPDGKYKIADVEITYDLGQADQRESTGQTPLEILYTAAGHGPINAEVMRHIDEVQIFDLNNTLQKAIVQAESVPTKDNKEEIMKVAQEIEKVGNLMGKRAAKKTMLAKAVLNELHAGGRVSKKTQLAMDDSSRQVEETPAPAAAATP
jgi:Ca-activated chloride channel homolog